jgi:hypothetical protein
MNHSVVPDPSPLDITRFISKVEPQDGCWKWLGIFDLNGYGIFKMKGRNRRAHRIALIMAIGQPTDIALQAAHTCHNRACVNPQHMRWATNKENMADKAKDGTAQIGTRHPRARLTEAQVLEIRALKADGHTSAALAESFGVTITHIDGICRGKSWRHV